MLSSSSLVVVLLLLSAIYLVVDSFTATTTRRDSFSLKLRKPLGTEFFATVENEQTVESRRTSTSTVATVTADAPPTNGVGSLSREDEEVLFGEPGGTNGDAEFFRARHRPIDKSGNILVDSSIPLNPLDHAKDPLINKLRTIRDVVPNCPSLWAELSKHCGNERALLDEHLCEKTVDVTFSEMYEYVKKSASIFRTLGVTKGTNVAVLGENSAYWLMIDHGLQLAGGVSAVRGADAPLDELRYIYEHSDSANIAVIQGPRLLQKLLKSAKEKNLPYLGLSNESHGPVKTVILMHREKKTSEQIQSLADELGLNIQVFADLLEATDPVDEVTVKQIFPVIDKSDLATIVYTSGTTGRPKGVMLTHGNLLHQMQHRLAPSKQYEEGEPLPGEIMVSLLPVWHITERTFELWMLSRGCSVVYSSIRTIKNDLVKHKPQWMVLVPRVLEKIALGIQDKFSAGSPIVRGLVKFFTATGNAAVANQKILNDLVVGSPEDAPGPLEKLASRAVVTGLSPINKIGDKLVWSKVKDGFGGRVKVIISGGSALAGSLESFYETCGLDVCVGYGLTECSPLISYRRSDRNLVTAGCAGKGCADTELRVVDPESKATNLGERKAVPMGQPGVVLARGPQIMKGYYKNREATNKAIDQYGWFETGDVGFINPITGDLILTGRAKDTIVLSNGENIEPVPIEDAVIGASSMVEQCMLTGQDGRRLVAVLVLRPEEIYNEGNGEYAIASQKEAKRLQKICDQINDPKCSEEECIELCDQLMEASDKLRSSKALKQRLMTDIKSATKSFRAWEQVGDIYITLEPFAMANGQLTQSYKVKRASVLQKYLDLLPK